MWWYIADNNAVDAHLLLPLDEGCGGRATADVYSSCAAAVNSAGQSRADWRGAVVELLHGLSRHVVSS